MTYTIIIMLLKLMKKRHLNFLYNLQIGLKDSLVLRQQSMIQSKGLNLRKLTVHQLSLSLNRKLRCLLSLTA